jgi:hypothetical protein
MKNRITSARTAAEKSTKVETQHPSSHSNGNTFVVAYDACNWIATSNYIPYCYVWFHPIKYSKGIYRIYYLLFCQTFWHYSIVENYFSELCRQLSKIYYAKINENRKIIGCNRIKNWWSKISDGRKRSILYFEVQFSLIKRIYLLLQCCLTYTVTTFNRSQSYISINAVFRILSQFRYTVKSVIFSGLVIGSLCFCRTICCRTTNRALRCWGI